MIKDSNIVIKEDGGLSDAKKLWIIDSKTNASLSSTSTTI